MLTCPNCQKQLADGSAFCDNCGTAQTVQPTHVFCTSCGAKNAADASFCTTCGQPMTSGFAPQAKSRSGRNPLSKLKDIVLAIPKKVIVSAVAVAVCVAIAVGGFAIFAGSDAAYKSAVYIRNGELYFSDLKMDEGVKISSKNDRQSISGVTVTQDASKIFYPDGYSTYSGYDLRVRPLSKRGESERIASQVKSYLVNANGTTVIYLNFDSELYRYNVKRDRKDKIASDVNFFFASEDCGKVVFTSDGDIYIKDGNKTKKKIGEGLIKYINEDFSTVYFLDDDVLYVKSGNKTKQKLVNDVDSVVAVYDSGEIYYTKSERSSVSADDYFVDDMLAKDQTMTQPIAPTQPQYPYPNDYSTTEQWEAAYSQYEAERDKYNEKYMEFLDEQQLWSDRSARNAVREEIAGLEVEVVERKLYYYNGQKSTELGTVKISDDSLPDFNCRFSQDAPVLVTEYFTSESTINARINMSNYRELGNYSSAISDITKTITDSLYSSSKSRLIVKDSFINLDCSVYNAEMSNDGKSVYYLELDENSVHGTLMKVAISGSRIETPKKYDSDVYLTSVMITEDGDVAYLKDVRNNEGTLYINKKSIADDVRRIVGYDNGTFYFATDADGSTYTLNKTTGGKAVKLGDDVYQTVVIPNGSVLYIGDWDSDDSDGVLYYCKGKRAREIDTKVTNIVYCYPDSQK